ncbi:hypothetical protein ACHAXA_001442, partial [Cyclostephanos tholiformis]
EVYDGNGVNRALNKPASQSSPFTYDPTNTRFDVQWAVDGSLDTFSHTDLDTGKYNLVTVLFPSAWWEVDLGEGNEVSRVTIYNRNDGDGSGFSLLSGRLSNSLVSLLNYQGVTLKTYRIGDATNIPVFDINFAGEIGVLITNPPTLAPTTVAPTFDAALVWRVRVQLEGRNYLHLREVEVFDQNAVNMALNKPATQSSNTRFDVQWAVDGSLDTFSHTDLDTGKYNLVAVIFPSAWWEVDLGEGNEVSRVTIYNRNDGDGSGFSLLSGRLSNSLVSLLNYQGVTLKTYRIGDATNIPVFDINFAGEIGVLITNPPTLAPTTSSPSLNPTYLVWKVSVQLEGQTYLNIREVEVWDQNGVNVALNKTATQSSTYDAGAIASNAVNGIFTDISVTNFDSGEYIF